MKLQLLGGRMWRVVWIALMGVAFFGWGGATVRADTPDGPDTPLFRKVSISTKTVRPDQTITMRVDVGDRWGIMESPYVEYRKADGVLGPSAVFTRVSGGIHNGVWEAKIYFDEYTPYGDAYIARLYAYDRHGHTTNLWEGEGVLADGKIKVTEYLDPSFIG